MRTPILCSLMVMAFLSAITPASAQDAPPQPTERPSFPHWHVGAGINLATIDFHQNGAGAFIVPIRYDFLQMRNSSFSLGTHLMAGTEDEYGVSFPVLVALLALANGAGAHAADFTNNYNDTGKNGYSIRFFTSIPLLLQFNIGYGSPNEKEYALGWFIGGGSNLTVTGYTYEEGRQRTTSFWGLVIDGGLRFEKNGELGFSITRPFLDQIGPIQHPLMFQLRLCGYFK